MDALQAALAQLDKKDLARLLEQLLKTAGTSDSGTSGGLQDTPAGTSLHDRRSFAAHDAALPRQHFYVPPAQMGTLKARLASAGRKYLLVCDSRQAGKTTLALALQRELLNDGFNVFYIGLGNNMPKGKSEGKEFWRYMASKLHLCDNKRFPAPSNNDPCHLATGDDFIRAFTTTSSEGPLTDVLLLDEASSPAKLDSRILDDFLEVMRQLRQAPNTTLHSAVLFGVYTLHRLLDSSNRRRTLPDGDAMDVDAIGDSDGSSSSSSNKRFSSSPVTSPFRADDAFHISRFTVAETTALIEQYVDQCAALPAAITSLQRGDVDAVARSIHSLTAGHKGLTGTCCDKMAVHEHTTFLEWEKYSSRDLADEVRGSSAYECTTNQLHKVFPPLAAEQQLQERAGGKWARLQLRQHALQCALLQGYVDVPGSELWVLEKLLQEGLLPVQHSSSSSGSSSSSSSSGSSSKRAAAASVLNPIEGQTYRLVLPAPIIATCIMRTMSMPVQDVASPPNTDTMDLEWLVEQVTRNLDVDSIMAKQAKNANGAPAEYAYQAQVYLLASCILRHAYGAKFKLIPEARNLEVDGHTRRRLDVLVLSDDGQHHGLELMAFAKVAEIDAHISRAALYSSLHASDNNGVSTPCSMAAVNFCMEGSVNHAAASHFGNPGPNVTMIHVVL